MPWMASPPPPPPPPPQPSFREVGSAARLTRPAIAFLYGQGCDVNQLLGEVGLDLATVLTPGARIPHRVLFDVWSRGAELLGDPDFGLRAIGAVDLRVFEQLTFASEYLPGQLFAASATLGEGLARLIRTQPLSIHSSLLELVHGPAPADVTPLPTGAVRLRHTMLDVPEVPRVFTEFWIAWIFRLIHELTAPAVTPLELRFAHPAPPTTEQHRRTFAVPLHFSAGEDALVLHEADLAAPLRSANPIVLDLERHAETLLARMPPAVTAADRVRALVAAELMAGDASSTQVARAMHVSGRTLIRRLAELGTSYQALLDEVRAGLARQYLLEEKRSVQDVAAALGFSDARAFVRAFRRWYGQSPSQFRDRAVG
jgi:AraC-like DNA-binding protein